MCAHNLFLSAFWVFALILPLVVRSQQTFQPNQTLSLSDFPDSLATDASGNSVLFGFPNWNQVNESRPLSTGQDLFYTDSVVSIDESAAGYDLFGVTLAISADGKVAFVTSANGIKGGLDFFGAIEIFERSNLNDDFSPVSEVNPPNTTNNSSNPDSLYGFHIATNFDGSRVLIGAPRDGTFGQDAGAVYFYQRIDGSYTWELIGLLGNDTQSNAAAGVVALSRDGRVAAVGAPEFPGQSQGIVWVYNLDVSLEPTSTLMEPALANVTFHRFGAALALSAQGEVLCVGMPGYQGIAGDTGAVRVFSRTNSGLYSFNESQLVLAADHNTTELVEFGSVVHVSDDGTRALFLGIYVLPITKRRGGSSDEVAVPLLFQSNGTTWVPYGQLTSDNPLETQLVSIPEGGPGGTRVGFLAATSDMSVIFCKATTNFTDHSVLVYQGAFPPIVQDTSQTIDASPENPLVIFGDLIIEENSTTTIRLSLDDPTQPSIIINGGCASFSGDLVLNASAVEPNTITEYTIATYSDGLCDQQRQPQRSQPTQRSKRGTSSSQFDEVVIEGSTPCASASESYGPTSFSVLLDTTSDTSCLDDGADGSDGDDLDTIYFYLLLALVPICCLCVLLVLALIAVAMAIAMAIAASQRRSQLAQQHIETMERLGGAVELSLPSDEEDSSTGDEESSTGDEESSTGDEESSTGDEDSSTGDEESSTGDEESSTDDSEL